jgi:uncharacterized membrane protein
MILEDSTVGGADTETTLHRLEAFSDIVIGFCIAEMGINLLVPQHVRDVRTVEIGVVGFVVSFALISIVWWIHQRIFRVFFILSRLTLVLNFTLLGSLVLMVYFQQIAVHFISLGNRDLSEVARWWLTSYGAVYGLLDALLWIGLRERWRTLPAAELRWGMQRASALSIGAAMFLTAGSGIANTFPGAVVIVGATAVLILRWVVPRVVDRVIATRA